MTKKESAATDGVIESDERALCIGDSHKEISLLRSDQLFNQGKAANYQGVGGRESNEKESNSEWYGR